MWRFISHPVMRPPLWTWEQVDGRGRAVKKSAGTFSSYRQALHDAARHGFDAGKDQQEKVEIENP